MRAQIGIGGNRVFLGDYPSEEDAARAYDVAAVQQYGKFAQTNFQRRS
jgi:hypothetical protein